MGFLTSFRAALLLGKANRQLQNGDYRPALERAQKAAKLPLQPQFAWLCAMIEGESRYHLGDREGAREPLARARDLLAPQLAAQPDSKNLQNILGDIESLLTAIDQETPT